MAAETHFPQKFGLERAIRGQITIATLQGVVNEGFEGRKVAESIRTRKLVVSMRQVRRFASWGMAEWIDFIRGNAQRDMYIVECSMYAVNQFTLVTGLLGHAKLVSFYVPFVCGGCSEETSVLMVVPLDRETLRSIENEQVACRRCGATARVDKYNAGVCKAASEKPAFDIDDEVVEYLRGLDYNITPDVNRFRAGRSAIKDHTYLRLSGNISQLSPAPLTEAMQGTTVVDLAGITVQTYDDTTLAPWRQLVDAALPKVTMLQLLDVPPGFLEHGVRVDDLHKLAVRTFALGYTCPSCKTAITCMVDVAANLEYLVEGTMPASDCTTCKVRLEPAVTPELLAVLRRLPARPHDVALDKFLRKARSEPAKNLDDALAIVPAKPVKPANRTNRMMVVVVGLMVLTVGGLAVIGASLWRRHEQPLPQPMNPVVVPSKPVFDRPDWIVVDQPGSALCQDAINRLVCIGVSFHHSTRNEAVADANDAALEELVNTVALKINEPFFKNSVLPTYTDRRLAALGALQAADFERGTPASTAGEQLVRDSRKRVAEILRASAGAAVPAQRSDWYWEEYANETGPGTEFLVFIRYDVPIDSIKSLVERYGSKTRILGSNVVTAFPALAWRVPKFEGGVVVMPGGGSLAKAGIDASSVVTAVGDQRIVDTSTFAKLVEAAPADDDISLTVRNLDGSEKQIEIRR